ncbi:MAG: hypothetical protein LBS54_08220 [Dysgonamonadaceae bacterium]|jgi:hypothetical protein|nr:hypothetical protein [Dysgonamonadaceae bacterium]
MNSISRKEFIKKSITGFFATIFGIGAARAGNQQPPAQQQPSEQQPSAQQRANAYFLTPEEKRAQRKGLIVKEENTLANGKTKWLDHWAVWDDDGYKLEEIEYNSYGIKIERRTYQYNKERGTILEERVYNDRNKLDKIRKYDYDPVTLRKTKQYNFLPNGKLYSTKIYEYTYQ